MPNDSGKTTVATPAAAPIKLAPVRDDGEFAVLLDSDRFAQIQRVAKLFSESSLVPEVFQGKPANCAVALQMAFRMRVDPMMLMQNMYIVHGRPGIEAKLAIALMNQRGPFTGPLQWKVEGEGDLRSWTCYATHRETQQTCEATVTWAMVVAEGWHKPRGTGERAMASKWTTLPDLMGRYRSAMFLGRLFCPEVLLGLPTNDELQDVHREAVERVVVGERVIDEEPINMPQATAPAASMERPGQSEPTTVATPGALETRRPGEAQPTEPEKNTEPDKPTLDKVASEAQRKMIAGIAEKHCKLTPEQLDAKLAEKFAFTLATLPMGMVNEALTFVRTLQPA
jgi:hypothetical protein